MDVPCTDDGSSGAAAAIERCLARLRERRRFNFLPHTLRFSASLEKAFDHDLRDVRVRELRFVLPLGICFFLATIITDPFFVPDLVLEAIVIRLIALPMFVFIIISAPRLSAFIREWLLAIAVLMALVTLTIVPSLSQAQSAPYCFATVGLAMAFAATSMQVRYDRAILMNALACVALFLAIASNRFLSAGLAFSISVQVAVAGTISLIAAYRIERSSRLGYLMAAKEACRLDALATDLAALAVQSSKDSLTGLSNRNHFAKRTAALFGVPASLGVPIGLLMIDVDYFKSYNDHYGHGVGDICLRAVAEAVSASLTGPDDLAVRYGGEEFVVLLCDVSATAADMTGQAIRSAVAARKIDHAARVDGQGYVTVSVGVSHVVLAPETAVSDLLEMADRALYRAKRLGRNRVEVQRPMAA